MRLIIPNEIRKMLDKQEPYLRYENGKGMVLVPNAPQEIVEIRKKTMKWFEEHREK